MFIFEYWYEGALFIMIFGLLILLPCVGVAILGYRTIAKMGHYPSKTPAIQMSICWKLVLLEIFSFSLLLGFYQIFHDV